MPLMIVNHSDEPEEEVSIYPVTESGFAEPIPWDFEGRAIPQSACAIYIPDESIDPGSEAEHAQVLASPGIGLGSVYVEYLTPEEKEAFELVTRKTRVQNEDATDATAWEGHVSRSFIRKYGKPNVVEPKVRAEKPVVSLSVESAQRDRVQQLLEKGLIHPTDATTLAAFGVNEEPTLRPEQADLITDPRFNIGLKKLLQQSLESEVRAEEPAVSPSVEYDTGIPLKPAQRAQVRQSLEKDFSLTEQKNLAFDLGVDYELFPHETKGDFSREFTSYCERRGQSNALVNLIASQRPNIGLGKLPADLPPSRPHQKVEISISTERFQPINESEVRKYLAAAYGVKQDEITIIGAAWGTLRLLVGLPKEVDLQNLLQVHGLGSGEYQIVESTAFESLDSMSQKTWHAVACNRPPKSQDDILKPTTTWQTAQEERLSRSLRRKDDWLSVDASVWAERLSRSLRRKYDREPNGDSSDSSGAKSPATQPIETTVGEPEVRVEPPVVNGTSVEYDTGIPLKPAQRTEVRQSLVQNFSITEMKTLAFDLGVDYELFPHETKGDLPHELISYCERRGRSNDLVNLMASQRSNIGLEKLLVDLPPSRPHQKVQISISVEPHQPISESKLRKGLAAMCGVGQDEIMIIGAAWGTLRLLVGLPKEVDLRNLLEAHGLDSGDYQIVESTAFESLDSMSQKTWRVLACNRPPESQDDILKPTTTWQTALVVTKATSG